MRGYLYHRVNIHIPKILLLNVREVEGYVCTRICVCVCARVCTRVCVLSLACVYENSTRCWVSSIAFHLLFYIFMFNQILEASDPLDLEL